MSDFEIRVVDRDELEWDYRGSHPTIDTGRYRKAAVDPTPCYSHDAGVVADAAAVVASRWELPVPLVIYLLPFEEIGRTNGHSQHERHFYEPAGTADSMAIVLSGKRIPIHPGITRYLVGHETGHQVQWWIQEAMGYRWDDDTSFEEDHYAPMRGLDHVRAAPGRWHRATGEVFACDFRVLMTGLETEFWPHPGIERPEQLTQVNAWWQMAQDLDFSTVARTPEEDS